jgi:hypothetical protein
MRFEDAKRLTIFSNHLPSNSPNPTANSVGRSNEELTGRKLLHEHFAIRAIAKALDAVRESHDVAVADSPDLHDLHPHPVYTRIYRMSTRRPS